MRVSPAASASAKLSGSGRSRAALEQRLAGFGELIAAAPSDSALVPSARSLSSAFDSPEQPTLAYTVGVIERVDASASLVRWQNGERGLVPNPLIIPIGKAELAQVSSVVLTSIGLGFGLSYGWVVRGGEPDSPLVRVLDAEKAPADPVEPDRRLPANSFRVLQAGAEMGGALACRRLGRVERFVTLRRTSAALLALGFAGQLELLDPAQCRALPLVPNVKPGDRVSVPLASVFVRASVERVDSERGSVEVLADFAGQRRPFVFGFTQVATELPP